jgi:hypothetical protein
MLTILAVLNRLILVASCRRHLYRSQSNRLSQWILVDQELPQ